MKFNIFAFLLITAIWALDLSGNSPENPKEIPLVMKKNNQPLFYIERSKNKNRVYYDANFNTNGAINPEKPIDVYWLNLEENYGKRGELSYIQEKMAYGYKSEKITDRCYQIKLKAFDKRIISLLIDNKGKAKTQMKIDGKTANLNHLFIKATDKGIRTSVEYIELYGTDIYSKTEVYEKIIP